MNISDFARFCGVTPRMLRHWERKDLIQPLRSNRGNNYRYYCPEKQVIIIHKIRFFKNLGFSLSEVGTLLDSNLKDFTVRVAEKYIENTTKKIKSLKRKEKILRELKESILRGKTLIDFKKEVIGPFYFWGVYHPKLDYSKITEKTLLIKEEKGIKRGEHLTMYLDRLYKPFGADVIIGVLLKERPRKTDKIFPLKFINIYKPYKKWGFTSKVKPGELFIGRIPKLFAYTYLHIGSNKEVAFIFDELNKLTYKIKTFHLLFPVFEIRSAQPEILEEESIFKIKIVFGRKIL